MAVPGHMPSQLESGVSHEEYTNADPNPAAKKRGSRGKYITYTKEDRAVIGKYASVNGNERARVKFLHKYPKLTESTVRSFTLLASAACWLRTC